MRLSEFVFAMDKIQRMNPWLRRPGPKIPILRFTLESWAQHMADPVNQESAEVAG